MAEDEIWKIVESNIPIDEEMVLKFSVLLKSGFDPFKIGSVREMNLLQKASLNGKTEIVRLILTPPDDLKGFDLHSFNENIKTKIDQNTELSKMTALHYASECGHSEIVKMLVSAGASIDFSDNSGQRPLHYACHKGHLEVVKILFRADPSSINVSNKYGHTALQIAAFRNRINIVEFLITATQAHPNLLNAKSKDGRTPLSLASENGNFEIVKMLVTAGASIDIRDDKGYTPLNHAVWYKNIVEFLITATEADPNFLNAKIRNGKTALHLASQRENVEILKILVAAGASIDIRDDKGYTPLHLAATYNRINIVKFLITATEADPNFLNAKSKDGRTPLCLASERGNVEILRILVAAGASTDIPDDHGNTPLHLAATESQSDSVEFLMTVLS
jgi:ankyrin repeat protein